MDFPEALLIIKEHILDGRHHDSPTLTAAIDIFNEKVPNHDCYGADRFAVAVLCGVPVEVQRKLAGLAWSHAMTGGWLWTTAFGFDAMMALQRIGVVPKETPTPALPPGQSYQFPASDPTLAALWRFANDGINIS